YELPSAPGHGYLKFTTDALVRFRGAYVSGPYPPPNRVRRPDAAHRQAVPFHAGYQPEPVQPEPVIVAPTAREDGDGRKRRAARGGPVSRSSSTGWRVGDGRLTRCGCRRSPSRPPSTSCSAPSGRTRGADCKP